MFIIEDNLLHQEYEKIITLTCRTLSIGPSNDADNLIKTKNWSEYAASASFFYLDWKKNGDRYLLVTERMRAQASDDIAHLAESAARAIINRSANCLGMCCVWVYLFLQTSLFKRNQDYFTFTFLELKEPFDHVWLKIKFKNESLYVDPHQKIIYNDSELKKYPQIYQSKFADPDEKKVITSFKPKIQKYAQLLHADVKKFLHVVGVGVHLELKELYIKNGSVLDNSSSVRFN